jgi:C-terminal processing protease CtpA/Prc
LAVDGVQVTALGFDLSIQRIRGAEGTRVALSIRSAAGGEPKTILVTRKRLKA